MQRTIYRFGFLFTLVGFSHTTASSQGIYNAANIVITGSPVITVTDAGFHNNGTFVPGTGTVLFNGSALLPTPELGGSLPTMLNNLTINKPSGMLELAGDVAIGGNLDMQQGNLELNLFTIDLGNGAGTILHETNTSRITGIHGGSILKTASLDHPVSANPGNIGAAISSGSDLGNTVIRRGHQQQTSGGGGFGINRYFDITPEHNGSLDASLQFFYFDNELAGINKAELVLYKSEDAGATWSFIGADNTDLANDWVKKNNIDQFSRWTLSSNINNPLPLTLLTFTANLVGQQTQLQWTTAEEVNSDHFLVERSTNGKEFSELTSVKSHNSTLASSYQSIDPDPVNGIDYYRLKMVDRDGSFRLSPVVQILFVSSTNLSIYPNPVQDAIHIRLSIDLAQTTSLMLMDENGKIIRQQAVLLNRGVNLLSMPVSDLPQGVYFIRTAADLMPACRIVKE